MKETRIADNNVNRRSRLDVQMTGSNLVIEIRCR